jgi:hypothetical protein
MMIDWLTVEVPDPVGLPINDGHVCRIRPDGTLDWSTACKRQLEGSWASSMLFRALGAADDGVCGSGLQISGNPAKFLAGHNLFGPDCPTELLSRLLDRVGPTLWPTSYHDASLIDLAQGDISRIDLTGSWLLDRAEDCVPYLRAMEELVWCPYRGRGVMDSGGSTLYYGRTAKGKRAKDWQLKLYAKGPEITFHRLPLPAYSVPGLLDHVNRTLRVELTLRLPELKKLGLTKVGDWTPEKVAEVWRLYVAKLDFAETTLNLDTLDLAELGLKTRHATALAAWKAGNDLRACMSKTAFYRLRKELRELTGFDIANRRPKSNVVPLQRFVTAYDDAACPDWADALTEALSRAA